MKITIIQQHELNFLIKIIEESNPIYLGEMATKRYLLGDLYKLRKKMKEGLK